MMDKRRRILFFVSLIGIVVVSMLLLTTYAYQTIVVDYKEGSSNKINQNEVKTAKLDVSFTKQSENINFSNMPLLLDYKTADYTEFIITNNSTNVISYSIGLTDLTYNSVLKTSDFKYTITKVNESNETVIGSGDFSSLTGDSFELKFNIGNYMDILVDESNKLRLYLWLQETDEDQSSLESSTSTTVSFKGKLEITSVFSIDIPFNESTLLAENIINNAKLAKKNNSDLLTKFMEPVSKIAENVSEETERILFLAEDDYGSSYYYRGNVTDNYVTFSNKCWRIVRIEGDGSVKLTLESQSVCSESMTSNFSIGSDNWGYYIDENDRYIGDYKNSTSGMKNLLNTWFDTNFKSDGNLTNAGLKIKNEEWCLSLNDKVYTQSGSYPNYIYTLLENPTYTSNFYYDSYVRLYGNVTKEPTLKCNGEKDISQIGALTADEVVYAGGKAGSANTNYYLQNDNYYWWTLSHSNFDGTEDYAFYVSDDGNLSDGFYVFFGHSVRPTVSLSFGIEVTTNADTETYGEPGTITNPYVVN